MIASALYDDFMKYRKKMMTTLFFMAVVFLSYQIFQKDIYTWLCEEESNPGACTVAGLLYKENNDIANAAKYLQKSCELDYALGCLNLAEIYQDNSRLEESKIMFQKACELGNKKACEIAQ